MSVMVTHLDLASVDDCAAFAKAHVSSGDIDPAYPVMKAIQQELFRTEAEKLWASIVYVAYYNLASAVTIWLEPWRLGEALPIATERRGFRDHRKLRKHLDDIEWQVECFGSYREWLTGFGERYDRVVGQIGLAWGNGRWACFKLAEILHVVHGWDFMAAPDMALKESSGPREGLELFVPPGYDLDIAAGELRGLLALRGARLEWEQLETVLCDFHAMTEGRYYVGHDIDQQLEQALAAPAPVRDLILRARAISFAPEYLGEVSGWNGVDKDRRAAYRATGAVLTR